MPSSRIDAEIRQLVERLWNYHRMQHELAPADAILVLCSHDTRVAERGAELFLEGWAPLLVFSGGLGVITRELWQEPEAGRFARVAVGMGVPEGRILVETASTNTGENILLSRQLLAGRGIHPATLVLVQKPYMERRSYATCRKLWPEVRAIVTSPQTTMDEYLAHYANTALSTDDIINIIVGDLQRIAVYPDRGFQVPQDIPDDVWAAYEALVAAGYRKRLVDG